MNRTACWVVAIFILQAVFTGIYVLVEDQRAKSPAPLLPAEPPRRVDTVIPSLNLRRRDGSTLKVPQRGRRTLIHVWASWCPPCRAELPGLLELAREPALDVVAIALDESWVEVTRLLGDSDNSNVFLANDPHIERLLGIRNLPVTFLVADTGRTILRFDGARDWTSPRVRDWLEGPTPPP